MVVASIDGAINSVGVQDIDVYLPYKVRDLIQHFTLKATGHSNQGNKLLAST